MAEKLGMRREGVPLSCHKDPRPDKPRIDFVHYGLLRKEWEQAAACRTQLGSTAGGHARGQGHAAEDRPGAEGRA